MTPFLHRNVPIELEESNGYSQISEGIERYRVTSSARRLVYRATSKYGVTFALTPQQALELQCKIVDRALAAAIPAEADQIEYAEFEPGGCWTNVEPSKLIPGKS